MEHEEQCEQPSAWGGCGPEPTCSRPRLRRRCAVSFDEVVVVHHAERKPERVPLCDITKPRLVSRASRRAAGGPVQLSVNCPGTSLGIQTPAQLLISRAAAEGPRRVLVEGYEGIPSPVFDVSDLAFMHLSPELGDEAELEGPSPTRLDRDGAGPLSPGQFISLISADEADPPAPISEDDLADLGPEASSPPPALPPAPSPPDPHPASLCPRPCFLSTFSAPLNLDASPAQPPEPPSPALAGAPVPAPAFASCPSAFLRASSAPGAAAAWEPPSPCGDGGAPDEEEEEAPPPPPPPQPEFERLSGRRFNPSGSVRRFCLPPPEALEAAPEPRAPQSPPPRRLRRRSINEPAGWPQPEPEDHMRGPSPPPTAPSPEPPAGARRGSIRERSASDKPLRMHVPHPQPSSCSALPDASAAVAPVPSCPPSPALERWQPPARRPSGAGAAVPPAGPPPGRPRCGRAAERSRSPPASPTALSDDEPGLSIATPPYRAPARPDPLPADSA